MTTRQEKRIRRKQLIHQLQRLEIQHQRVSGSDFIISQCEGCEICTKIRAIGKELSSPEDEAIGRRKGAGNHLLKISEKLTVDEYWAFKHDGLSDKAIGRIKNVSSNTFVQWKRDNNLPCKLPAKGVRK